MSLKIYFQEGTQIMSLRYWYDITKVITTKQNILKEILFVLRSFIMQTIERTGETYKLPIQGEPNQSHFVKKYCQGTFMNKIHFIYFLHIGKSYSNFQ